MNVIKKINVDGVEYDIQGKELTKVTYAELKSLRDNGEFAAGHLYRITDYVTTTTQGNTKSANHPFDVIVLAVSQSELSHSARAIAHEGDTYFDGNDLGAWELWYDLDNDTDKYDWADAENGKGVIYRMIDEKRNDCPYDFKNILFYNTEITGGATNDKYYYTFSYVVRGELYDGTVEKQVKECYNNSMGEYLYQRTLLSLPYNIFVLTGFSNYPCHSNTFVNNCYHNTFKGHCYRNTFGYNCYYNTFNSNCYCNTFGDNCYYNTFRYSCFRNTFGYGCDYNTFNDNCYSNTFGDNGSYNTFNSECYYNTFGDSCHHNTFNSICNGNTFGYNCNNEKFRDATRERKVDRDNTSITLNDEYFDDGSGQLVPIKHPDLSTQPSILPYKFMGQYVYEQLIPITDVSYGDGKFYISMVAEGNRLEDVILTGNPNNVQILSLEAFGTFPSVASDSISTWHIRPLPISSVEYCDADVSSYKFTGINIVSSAVSMQNYVKNVYVRIVYTTMPEENGGDYYGYENY